MSKYAEYLKVKKALQEAVEWRELQEHPDCAHACMTWVLENNRQQCNIPRALSDELFALIGRDKNILDAAIDSLELKVLSSLSGCEQEIEEQLQEVRDAKKILRDMH